MVDLPPKNHNNPPSELEHLEDNLVLRHVAAIRQAEAEVEFSKNIPEKFTDQNEVDFAADWIKKVKEIQKQLEAARKAEKEPFLRQGQFVDKFFNFTVYNLEKALINAEKPLSLYLYERAKLEQADRQRDAENLRQEQQRAFKAVQQLPAGFTEESQKAVEHLITIQTVATIAEKDAMAPVVTMAQASGKYSKATLVKKWVGVIVNRNQLDLLELRPYLTEAHLQVALNAYVKAGGRKIEGARIEEIIDASVK